VPSRRIKKRRRPIPSTLVVQLVEHVALQAHADGEIIASFGGHAVSLGRFSAAAAARARNLHIGLPIATFASRRRRSDREIIRLVQRLAQHGLVEYHLRASPDGDDQVVIEPQTPDYWPRLPALRSADVLALSRFAYTRRRGNDMVLETPLGGAIFRIVDPTIATALAALSTSQKIRQLRRRRAFPGTVLLALLIDCRILFKLEGANSIGARSDEGDNNLVLWDFHDLVFHARSTIGRHANPLGASFPYASTVPPLPAVRPRWSGRKIDLRKFATAWPQAPMPLAKLLRRRRSTRHFDGTRPVVLAELARFLGGAARVIARSTGRIGFAGSERLVTYTRRPYPSAGGAYELELYLAVDKCEGLPRGFYHYDADAHALVRIGVAINEVEAQLREAGYAMGVSALPPILITLAARFGRMSWKYSSAAYALVLKDTGVLTQTLYLMAAELGLGGCAIGQTNIDRFARMTGLEFYAEGPVGQFALGRGK